MKPINCPACVARMTLCYAELPGENTENILYQCHKCFLAGPIEMANTHRGAAIKAGRAMRGIADAVEARIATANNAAFAHGLRVGERDMARRVVRLLLDSRLTRMGIAERMTKEAAE